MDQPKRRRGRPKGASRLNPADEQILIKVAGIVDAEAIPASTAMHRFGFVLESAGLRRLQRKWKGRRDWYLAEARRLAAAKPAAARSTCARHVPSPSDMLGITAQMTALGKMMPPSALWTAEQRASIFGRLSAISGPRLGASLAALDSPTFKALQRLQLDARALHPQGIQHFAEITGAARQLQGTISSITRVYGGRMSLSDILKR